MVLKSGRTEEFQNKIVWRLQWETTVSVVIMAIKEKTFSFQCECWLTSLDLHLYLYSFPWHTQCSTSCIEILSDLNDVEVSQCESRMSNCCVRPTTFAVEFDVTVCVCVVQRRPRQGQRRPLRVPGWTGPRVSSRTITMNGDLTTLMCVGSSCDSSSSSSPSQLPSICSTHPLWFLCGR